MAFQKGHAKVGGRKKGTRSKGKTQAERLAPALASIVSTGSETPTQEREGIEPKSLLLDSMRGAWDAAHRCSREAAVLEAMSAGMPEGDARKALESKVAALKAESGGHVAVAQDMAVKVAPYLHPRLANLDNKVSGALTIVQKRYGPDGEPKED